MCAIAGLLSARLDRHHVLFEMTDVQRHRGPDGRRYLFLGRDRALLTTRHLPASDMPAGRLALGHCRLSVLDLTDAGQQPMSVGAQRYWIVYNGEVYNYIELREELERLDYRFATQTDTEVVLNAYRAWGTDCLSRFNGMWSLAIWDSVHQRLILARDRFGVKPLYYAWAGDTLIFASEIKGVLASGRIAPRLNPSVTADFLRWGMTNCSDETFFTDIYAFPPASFAVVDPDEIGHWQTQSYWQLKRGAGSCVENLKSASTVFTELFESAVNIRLRSDVPVGFCLSGGLDSSAIVCVASRLTERRSATRVLNTFTAAALDLQFDEQHYARLVNRRVGAAGHVAVPSVQGFLQELPQLLWHQEEPFTTTSIYAQWCVMRLAQEAHVPVLLDGQGADESLCGYRKYYLFYLSDLARAGHWLRLIRELSGLLLRGDRGFRHWREGTRYLPALLRHRLPDLGRFTSDAFADAWHRSYPPHWQAGDLRTRQIDDLLHFSVPSLLRYEDRNSMAWSIESRVPFLDYRLVEFILGLPSEWKLAGGRSKVLMRRALQDALPPPVLARRDKMGFVTPQAKWLRQELGYTILKRLQDKACRLGALLHREGLVSAFERYLAHHSSPGGDDFLRAYLLDRWMERFQVTV